MNKSVPYIVFLPANYTQQVQAGKKFSVIYLLHQYYYSAAGWYTAGGSNPNPELDKNIDSVANIIGVAPQDGNGSNGRGWWLNSPTSPSVQWSTFLVNELKPAIDAAYATYTDRTHTGICGVSMGGYGALHNLRIHSETFRVGYAIVACTDLSNWTYNHNGGFQIESVLGDYAANTARWNSFNILPNAADYKSRDVKIGFHTTVGDFFKDDNVKLHNALVAATVNHEFTDTVSGGHASPTSASMRRILKFFQSNFGGTAISMPTIASRTPGRYAVNGAHRVVMMNDGSVSVRILRAQRETVGINGRVFSSSNARPAD